MSTSLLGTAGGDGKKNKKPDAMCEICGKRESKYCCPKCDKKTCSLDCVKEHKEATGCTGKRDRTAFLGRGELDERSLLSDYKFLEQVKLAEDVAKRAKPPAPKSELPHYLQSFIYQARRRGVQLHLLAPGMERRRSNTSRYDNKSQILSWRLEWSFVGAGSRTADTKVSEETIVEGVLAAHLTPPPGAALKTLELQRYADCGRENLVVLMRKERTPANSPLYYRIDCRRPLREVLQGKVIVEFPVLLVLLPEEAEGYNLVEEGKGEAMGHEEGPPHGKGEEEVPETALASKEVVADLDKQDTPAT